MEQRRVAEVMTPSPAWCVEGDCLPAVAREMVEHQCPLTPVVDDPHTRRPVGVITDWDIVSRVVARGLDPASCAASEVMTPHPVTLRVDATFKDCAWAMQTHHVRRVLDLVWLRKDGST